MYFYVFFTTLLLENKGSDVAKGFAGFQIPFRTRDFFFLLGGRLSQLCFLLLSCTMSA